jgi:hypothetical protein
VAAEAQNEADTRRASHSRPVHNGGRDARRGARAVLLAVLIFGLTVLVVALTGVAIQLLPRQFSAAQQRQITGWEVSKRWRTMPAGRMFPAAVPYSLSAAALNDDSGVNDLTADRVGIGPQSRCATAADPAAASVLVRYGCQAVLRATYADATGSYIVTLGVAVLPSAGQASAAQAKLTLTLASAARDSARLRAGVRALPFDGTVAAKFGNQQRQVSASISSGPYIVLYTVGYSDGRPRVPVATDPYTDTEMTSAAGGVAQSVASTLGAQPAAPHCPGTPGC